MRSKNFWTALILGVAVFCACERQEDLSGKDESVVTPSGETISVSSLVRNTVRIKVDEELSACLEKQVDTNGKVLTRVSGSGLDALALAGVISLERTFPYAGEFEARTRAAGLHLWYDAAVSESAFTRAGTDLSAIEGVQTVEYRPKIVQPECQFTVVSEYEMVKSGANADYPFNDPYLEKQWHYFNNGTASVSVAGCDINVFPAWKKYKPGSSDVVVSVVDGGIDYSHPDLHDNMWHNSEQSREDWQYGYNFVTRGYLITPHDHGTHVAGTISAVNNNGLGVCGVAGGNKSKGIPGVRLMSCQIFDDTETGTANAAAAIKWGADHGAVISQNSWGYDGGSSIQTSDREAIDYFNRYAGFDSNGQQVGPMAGGVVIFAAGNDNATMGYPAAYEGCIAVTALGANYRRAYYSNYGDWADIAAPGGDAQKGNEVLSTLPGEKYGKMQGTSMACPHVSGVAALIVANCGGKGFTNTELKNRLLKQVTSISKYNPNYALGSGLVNAYAAIAKKQSEPPEKITEWSAEAVSNNIYFRVKIPRDPDDGTPYGINIHYSKSSFSDPADVDTKSFPVGSLSVGDYLEGLASGLEFETKYYVAATAYDMSGSRSPLSDMKTLTTGSNNPPLIIVLDSTDVSLRSHQTVFLRFVIYEPDFHKYECVLVPEQQGVALSQLKGDTVQVKIEGNEIDPEKKGEKQSFTLTATDEYGASAVQTVSYTVLPNTPPSKKSDIPDLTFSAVGEVKVLDMNEYFTDVDGEQLTYTVTADDNSVINFNQSGNSLYATAMKLGQCSCVCTAADMEGKSVSSSFRALVSEKGRESLELFPLPVNDVLNVRYDATATASCDIFNAYGAKVLTCTLNLSPFNSVQIDMSSLPGGVYRIRIQLPDRKVERTVTKL